MDVLTPSRTHPRHRPVAWFALLAVLGLLTPVRNSAADQVDMQNGDRYLGKVVSLNSDFLIFHNEVLGNVRLPRTNIASIVFGATPAPARTVGAQAPPAPARAATTNGNADFSATLRQLAANSNMVRQVQNQILGGAGPEANAKFNELLNGLAGGQISLGDLRAQAASAADQLRALKKELGSDSGVAIDGYLEVLDDFLKESEGTSLTATNSSLKN